MNNGTVGPLTVTLPREDWRFLVWIVRTSTTNETAIRIAQAVHEQTR